MSHSFFFIHINKTGGSSFEAALGLKLQHKTALEKIQQVGRDVWDQAYTFSVVRNPWDKVASHYFYRVQTNQTGMASGAISFNEWVQLAYGDNNPVYFDNPKMFMPQVDWLCDLEGSLLVDKVCRFESLEDEFLEVCNVLRIQAKLPHHKASKHADFRTYYNDNSVEIVANWFRRDIEVFQYNFA